jgi:hypothetical protein
MIEAACAKIWHMLLFCLCAMFQSLSFGWDSDSLVWKDLSAADMLAVLSAELPALAENEM